MTDYKFCRTDIRTGRNIVFTRFQYAFYLVDMSLVISRVDVKKYVKTTTAKQAKQDVSEIKGSKRCKVQGR